MKARIKLTEGMTFVAESGSGHAIVLHAGGGSFKAQMKKAKKRGLRHVSKRA